VNDVDTGRHPISIGHLVMGLALLGIVGIWALWQTEVVDNDDVRWLLAIPWVVAGAVGLAATAITGPRRYAVRQTGWVGAQPEPPRESEQPHEPELPEEPEPVEETAPLYAQTDPQPDEKNDPEETS
jgi:outer membrane biosynthesis protein TonB